MKRLLTFIMAAVAFAAFAEEKTLNDYFPEKYQNWEVKRNPLTAEQREAWKKEGISDTTLDLYGDVFVSGYGADEYRWGDLKLDELGPEKVVYDTKGMRQLPALPKSGHPRMFFTDAERQMHRDRLEKTEAGKVAMKIINACVAILKGTFDKNADYAKPDIMKGSFGSHGFLPLFRYGDRSGKAYELYAQGKTDEKLKVNLGLLAVEAYRCWVFDDKEAAKLAAKVLETSVREAIEKADPKKRIKEANFNLATSYDMLYNYMTPEQQKLIHSVIMLNNYDNNQYGCFQNATTSTSNWTTFSYRIYAWLPLEGDPGYNELMYKGYVRGLHNFLTYGWFKRGPCWEGMGKNQLGGEIAYVMTRRGNNLIAHPHLLAHMREYMPHAILPWGGEYIAYDRLGGRRLLNANDMLPIKYMFPDDKLIDWVYRNAVYDDYSFTHRNIHAEFHADNVRVGGWGNNALHIVMFLTDYMKSNNDPAKLGLEESFFGAQRGLMITRSDWKKDAAYLQHHCRGASGGHVFADRNNFIFGGKGRMWVINGSHSYETGLNNVVTIDDWTQKNNAPGKMIDYKRTPLATFSCGDAKPAYEWEFKSAGKWGQYTAKDAEEGKVEIPEGWEKDTFNFNDFAYEKDPQANFTQEYFVRPDWLLAGKISATCRKRRDFPIKKAFRSVGLVRGKNPYAIIVDDYAATDGKDHRFTWSARLVTDVGLMDSSEYTLNTDGTPVPKNKKGDRTITEITLFGVGGLQKLDQYGRYKPDRDMPGLKMIFIQKEGKVDKTCLPSVAIDGGRIFRTSVIGKEPKFKVILYPYIHGRSQIPKISFDKDGNLLMDIGGQKDIISFKENAEGRTGINIVREEKDQKQEFAFGM